jgi:magnesium transporter
VITISSKSTPLFDEMIKNPRLNTSFKTRLLLQFLIKTSQKYLTFLKDIEHIKNQIEARALKSISNHEIMELMKLQKSLVYFTTSLRANELMLDRIRQGKVITLYDDDSSLMDDVIIEIKQAREMADIHERILSNTMDNYGSIIANNLNDIMKVLTSVTLLLSIPMIIFGFYGMNVQGLWFPESPYFAIGLSLIFVVLIAVFFIRRRML